MRTQLIAALVAVGLAAAGCGWKPTSTPSPQHDSCKDSDGPTPAAVRRAIEGLPITAPASSWAEIARGHAKGCRLYWVHVIPNVATEATPQQLLFFDHNTPLGTPTANPKPYTSVLSSSDDAVKVQYQWRLGNDPPCCPTGIGTVSFRIDATGALQPLGPIPNQNH